MTLTHWLPPFTYRDRWNQQQAACGEYVPAKEHSAEPTCAECAKYLSQDRALDDALEATFADAPSDPALEVKHIDFDPTCGVPRSQYVTARRDPRR